MAKGGPVGAPSLKYELEVSPDWKTEHLAAIAGEQDFSIFNVPTREISLQKIFKYHGEFSLESEVPF